MEFVFLLFVLVISVVVHEVSHGAVANSLGDPTAKNAGRLTLNPIGHVDPVGSLLLPFLLILSGGPVIGWAKPVPINPFMLKNQTWAPALVSLAGPGSNLALALVFGLLVRFLPLETLSPLFSGALVSVVQLNLYLALFNLVPIPPLDGSHLLFAFLPKSLEPLKMFLARYGFFILLFLVFLFPPFLSFLSFLVRTLLVVFVGA
ncbi:MAG: Zn-dependent protease [Parcubacteria group bacterium Greene0416_39]|nr:MAG: Zn-dependent protease [Parcubacteria group bacterium Greene0416_39]TSC97688.1 MAG: Zn-dependent protease [Parcubacteria group bacterium Greene1014_47]